MLLTAVVLNWETPELAERSVRALVADGVDPARIVIVDNGSRDGSRTRLEAMSPAVTIVGLHENCGFAAGNNAGAAALPGDAYLFVNSDAFARGGAVRALLERLAGSRVGVVVPRLLNPDGTRQPSVVPRTSLLRELGRTIGLTRIVRHPGWSTHWAHDRARRIDSAIGAVILVGAAAWEDLGGFDERRFMYSEDLDLFWRARERSWHIWFEPRAEFVHLGSATADRRWTPAGRAKVIAQSEAEMIHVHLGGLRASATLMVMATGTGLRAALRHALGDRDRASALTAFTRGYLLGAFRRR